MTRGYTTESITALADNPELYQLSSFAFSTPLYYTTAPYDITYDGNLYISSPIVPTLPVVKETLSMKPNTLDIPFSGAPLANQSLLLTENFNNVDVNIYKHVVATEQTLLEWEGRIQNYSTSEDKQKGTSTITWACTNHFAGFNKKNGRVLTHENQQALYSGDYGLEYLNVTKDVISDWAEADTESTSAFEEHVENIVGIPESLLQSGHDLGISITNNLGLTSFGRPTTGGGDSLGYDAVAAKQTKEDMKLGNVKQHSPVRRLQVAYGQAAIKPIPCFRTLNPSDKSKLWVVYLVCEGEVDSLVDITFKDGESYLSSRLSSVVSKKDFLVGTTSQTATAALVALSAGWTTAHKLNGICTLVIEYTKSELLNGEPQPLVIVKAKKCYDPRDGTTAWTTQPALHAYDQLTNNLYGLGLDSSKIDGASFGTGATLGETTNTNHDDSKSGDQYHEAATTVDLFGFNGVMSTDTPIVKRLDKINFNMRGHIAWYGGKYHLVNEQTSETSSFTFDEDNITGSFNVTELPANDKYNTVFYEFNDAALNYTTNMVRSASATFLSNDNGIVSERIVNNIYETDKYRAKNRAATILKKSREGIRVSLQCNDRAAMNLTVGEIVDITRDSQGWTNKLFRITMMTISMTGLVSCNLEEYESTVYDWAVSVEDNRPDDTTLPDPFTIGDGGTPTAADSQLIQDDGTATNRLYISFTAATDVFVEGYEAQYRHDTDNWVTLPNLNGRTTTDFYIDNVVEGQDYDVRIRSFNSQGTTGTWKQLASAKTSSGTQAIGRTQLLIGTNAYENESIFYHTFFDSIDSFTSSGATLDSTNGLKITGSASLARAISGVSNSLAQPTWGKNRRFKVKLTSYLIDNLTGDAFVGMGNTASNAMGFILRYTGGDTEVYGVIYISGTPTLSTLISSATTTVRTMTLECIFTSGTSADFYVDSSSQSLTTGLPTGTTAANTYVNAAIPASSTGYYLYIGEWRFLQE